MPKKDPRAKTAAPEGAIAGPAGERTFDTEATALAELGFSEVEFELTGGQVLVRAMRDGAPVVTAVKDEPGAGAALVARLAETIAP